MGSSARRIRHSTPCVASVLGLSFVLGACGSDRAREERSPATGELEVRSAEERAPALRLETVAARSTDEAHATTPSSRTATAEPVQGRAGPWTNELRLASAPFDEPRAPSVIVHAGPSFDPRRPLRLVVFLHGWSGCARVLVSAGPTPCRDGAPPREGWALADRFDEAGTDALFVIPQLAFLRRDGSPGRFADDGRFRAFVIELLGALEPMLGVTSIDRLESVSLLAHSAGFETALSLLAHGGVDIDHVVLFDALYRGVEPFTSWVAGAPGRRLVSLYTGGRTERQSRRLARHARAVLDEASVSVGDPPLADAVLAHRVTIARTTARHADVPAHHLAELLPALGLSSRP